MMEPYSVTEAVREPLGINRKLFGTRSYRIYKHDELYCFYYPLANVSSFIGQDGIKRAMRWPFENGIIERGRGPVQVQVIVNKEEGISFYETLSEKETMELAERYYPSDEDLQFAIFSAFTHEVLQKKGLNAHSKFQSYNEWMYDIKDSTVRQYMDERQGNALKREADIEHQNELAERI